MRRSLGGLVALGVLATAAPAVADDALAWRADDHCGSVAALRARIALHLGRPLAATDAIRAVVEVVRTPIEGDVRATLQIVTRRGPAAREVHGANCAAVVDAVAFVLASAVVEDGEAPARPATPAVAEAAAGPWGVRPVAAPAVATERPPRLTVTLGLGGWSDAGTLPEFRLGVGGAVAVSRGRIRGEVSVATWPDRLPRAFDRGSGAAGTTLRSAAARGCYGVRRLWLCGGALVGVLREAPGVGAAPTHDWLSVSFQTVWSRPVVGRVGIAGSIEALANLVGPDDTSGLAVRLGLAVVVTVR